MITEGPNAGKDASVTSGYLVPPTHLPAAIVHFYTKNNVFSWAGGPQVQTATDGAVTGGIPTFTDSSNQVPAGIFNIEIPDFPHEKGRLYIGVSPHSLSWFRLATPRAKDRYIHVGTRSAGCTTVGIERDSASAGGLKALKNFELLYAYLIKRRSRPGDVGRIKVFPY